DFLLDLSMTRNGEEVVGLPTEGVIKSMRVNKNNENKVTSVSLTIVEKEMLDALLSIGQEINLVLSALKDHSIKIDGKMALLEDSGYDAEKEPKIVKFEGLKGELSLAVSAKNKQYIRQVNIIATNYTIHEYEDKKK